MKFVLNILLIFSVLWSSCKKEPLKCAIHCGSITIKGQVKNNVNGLGVSDIPVTLSWRRNSACLFCRSETIATLKSDNSGNFNISFTADSTRFSSAYIEVSTPVNNGFFYEPLASNDKKSSHTIDSIGNHTVNFELFPKTMLKINVKRLPNQGLTTASIGHSFAKNSFGNYWWTDKDAIKDTVLIVETAADIFTKITWHKSKAPGQNTEFQDSIKCILNKENQFDISF